MSVGNRILKCEERLDKEVIKQFEGMAVAQIGDAMNKNKCIHQHIRPFNKLRLLGQAYTVKVPAGDNLFILYAIEHAKEGDIIVVDGEGYEVRALVGELLSLEAVRKKIGGFVIDGAVRDIKEIEDLPISIYARCCSPNGPYKNGPGEINVPVVIDGQVVNPGDLLVGDEEGIVVISPDEVEEVYAGLQQIMASEVNTKKLIAEGKDPFYYVAEKLEALKTEIEE